MTRLEQARAEITSRLASAVRAEDGWRDISSGHVGDFIAENCPGYARLVLAAADATLDRHARTHRCLPRWLSDEDARFTSPGVYVWPLLLCADAAAVLDLYAPEPQP